MNGIRARAILAVVAAVVAAGYGLATPRAATAASTATIISYQDANLTGSSRPYSISCPLTRLYCTAISNLDKVSGPCQPNPWSSSTWNDCISSVYFQNYTSSYLLVLYRTDANYGGNGWAYCVRPGTSWSGNVPWFVNDAFSSLSANFYTFNPGQSQGNC
jgi:hypothetical protein